MRVNIWWCCCAGALSTLVSVLTVFGIVSTAAGWLIVSDYLENVIRAVHIPTGAVEKIDTASAGKLHQPQGLAVNESDRMCYIANQFGHYITAVTIPARYFTASAGTVSTGPVMLAPTAERRYYRARRS